jgi:hypothetical protein
MPFFSVLPLWAFCVLAGVVLLFFHSLRRIGYFVIAIPTGAALASFAPSTLVLYCVPRLAGERHGYWLGVALIAGYGIASCSVG